MQFFIYKITQEISKALKKEIQIHLKQTKSTAGDHILYCYGTRTLNLNDRRVY